MANQEPIRKRPNGPGPNGQGPTGSGPVREIPDKLYFRIGEVAKLCEVPAYVLRFWEGEFPQLKPNKGGTGQRLFRRRDVEMALRIKSLLYDEGYTIPGARAAFKAELRTGKDAQAGIQPSGEATADSVDTRHLVAIQKELRELHALLSKPAASRQSVRPIRVPKAAPAEAAAAPQAPTPFLKPRLLRPMVAKEKQPDDFMSSLFDDLPPIA